MLYARSTRSLAALDFSSMVCERESEDANGKNQKFTIFTTYFRGHKFIAEAYEHKKRISVLDDETRIQYIYKHTYRLGVFFSHRFHAFLASSRYKHAFKERCHSTDSNYMTIRAFTKTKYKSYCITLNGK